MAKKTLLFNTFVAMSIAHNLKELKHSLPKAVSLVAVSKTKPASAILEAYDTGHRIFGENKVQELVGKYEELPKDIQWHMIGHLQRNKVKYIAPFVALIHGVDSERLLLEINKQGIKHQRKIPCLLQMHIATEATKFGLSNEELEALLPKAATLEGVAIRGLMGMATFTSDEQQIEAEFNALHASFQKAQESLPLDILSMGMSGDYPIALSCGSTMIRVGSKIFGARH